MAPATILSRGGAGAMPVGRRHQDRLRAEGAVIEAAGMRVMQGLSHLAEQI
jgi:hypothetical protein